MAIVVTGAVAAVLIGVLSPRSKARREARRAHARVDAMVRYAPVGMAFVDLEQRFVEANETLAALGGRNAKEVIGLRLSDMDSVPPRAIELVEEVLRTGESKLDVPFLDRDVRVMAGFSAVRGPEGEITGVGVVVREVSAEQQRDVLFDRVTRLQELTGALARAGSAAEVIEVSVRSMQRAVDARAVSFCRLDGGAIVQAGAVGLPDDVVDEPTSFPLVADLPLAEAVRSGEPVTCSTREAMFESYPGLRVGAAISDSRSIAAIPLLGEGSVIGAIGMSFTDERDFGPDELSFIVAAATQCATAYGRAIAFEAERTARRAAEAASRRLAYLSDATQVLSQSLDPVTTMQRLAELAVPTLGDWCAVHVVDGEYARPVAMASENPDATAAVRDLSERNPVPIGAPAGLGAVVRTGEPIVVRSVTMDAVRASTDAGEVIDLLSRLRAIAIVPMTYQGVVLGTITLSNVTDRELDDADVDLARELAARAAQAISNAQLYQERNSVASTLQASLLPPARPMIPGIDVATRFLPAAEGLDVGGDFYDVVRLGTVDDPAPTWALVIGDVRGKGADAAAITGIARATIRAAALDEPSPAQMLARLNQVLLAAAQDDPFAAETGEPRFCTACVITLSPTNDGADLVIAVGGHPLPYVLRADGSTEQVGEHGGLIGVVASPSIVDVPGRLEPGDALVLYTDGITERHEGDQFLDEEGLADVLADCRGFDALDTAVRVEVAARGFVDAAPRDDIAVLVARVPDLAGRLARHLLPTDERAAILARGFVTDALRSIGLGAAEIEVATLLASELVTNAVVHGSAPIDIDVGTVDGGVRVSVGDRSPRVPSARAASEDEEHGRGLLLVGALSDRWGVDAQPPGKRVWFELRV